MTTRDEPLEDLGAAQFAAPLKNRTRTLTLSARTPGEAYAYLGREPVPDPAATYEAGSLTKAVTGTTLAALVLAGTVALDADAGSILGVQALDGVTLASLATHSSGLPRLGPRLLLRAARNPNDPYSGVDEKTLLRSVPKPKTGAKPEYSNLGFAVLGACLARAAGEAYTALATRLVLQPAGVRDGGFGMRPTASAKAKPWTQDAFQPVGGLRLSPADAQKLLQRLLNPGDDDLGRALALATTPRSDLGPTGQVGLGWLVTPDGTIWHNGATGRYWSWISASRVHGVGLAALAIGQLDDTLDISCFRLMRTFFAES